MEKKAQPWMEQGLHGDNVSEMLARFVSLRRAGEAGREKFS